MTAVGADRYTSADFLRQEFERLWPRVWQCAGWAADLDREGAYLTYEIGDDSILVVKQADGVRAFHNVCRHRGRRLREPGPGHAQTFQCPYHHWEWEIDGSLKHVPRREQFPQLPEASCLGLVEVSACLWGGFAWIHFDRDAPPLAEYLGAVATRLRPYRMADYTLIEDLAVDIDCNWKTSLDAANEAYHIGSVHPQMLDMVDPLTPKIENLGLHSEATMLFAVPSPQGPAPDKMNPTLEQMLREVGVDPVSVGGSVARVRPEIMKAMRTRTDMDFSELRDDQLIDDYQYHIFPNLTVNVWPTRMLILRHRPHPTDPGRMLMDEMYFERLPPGAAPPPRKPQVRVRHGEATIGVVTEQDAFNCVRVQQGMRSRACREVHLGEDEVRIQHMHRSLDEVMRRS